MGKQRPWLAKHQFKKGHPYMGPPSNSKSESRSQDTPDPWMKRLTQKDFNQVVKVDKQGRLTLPDADGVCSGGKVLRPQHQEEINTDISSQYLDGEGKGEYRLLHRDKTIELMNSAIAQHAERMGERCKNPQFSIKSEKQKGLCWKMSLVCTICQFEGTMQKLYEEVQSTARGPKHAKPNLGLQVALQDSSIGNSKVRLILLALNVPAPAESGMQKAANKVGEITAKAAEEDLKLRCAKLKEINEMRNLDKDAPINISVDARYNSTSITSRQKMGQSATQAIAVAVEQSTEELQVIGMCLENKLCHQGALMRSKGIEVSCPGHAGCTANKKMPEPFSEYEMGLKLGKDLAEQQMQVKHVISDADGRSSDGIRTAMNEVDPLSEVIRQADTTHLGQSQFRKTNKTTFSKGMLPGTSRDQLNDQRKMFALDLKHRTHLIFHKMYEKTSGDIKAISKKIPTVIECTIDCYSGDHSTCKKESVVCKGGKKNWLSQSVYLSVVGISSLTPNEQDKKELRKLMKFYLGPSSLQLLKLNGNTNKNEAINRAISVSLPKNVHFSRNARPRAYSAICRINKGNGNSMHDNLEAVGCPLSKGGRVASGMYRVQTRCRYHRCYDKSDARKFAKSRWRMNNIREFYKCRDLRGKADYCKGQLDPPCGRRRVVRESTRKARGDDHAYCVLPFRRKFDHQYFKQ